MIEKLLTDQYTSTITIGKVSVELANESYLNTLRMKCMCEATVPEQTKGWCFIFVGKLGSGQPHILFLEGDTMHNEIAQWVL